MRSSFAFSVFLWLGFAPAVNIHAAEAPEPQWMWFDDGDPLVAATPGKVWFRIEAKAAQPSTGALTIACDDHFTVWVNGQRVGAGDATKAYRFNLSGIVDAGTNVVAIEAENREGRAGLYVRGGILYQRQKRDKGPNLVLDSGPSWRATREAPAGDDWLKPRFDMASWKPAKALTPHADSPWKALSFDETHLDRYTLPPGFQIERIGEPDVVGSLIAMTWGNRGRLLGSQEKGPIVSLVDEDGNGTYEKATEFSSDVKNCQGLCVVFSDVYAVGEGPQGVGIYRLPDTNGDDRADSVELISLVQNDKGGPGAMRDHGPHVVTYGPDGSLYFVQGNHGRIAHQPEPTSGVLRTYEGDLLRPRFEDARGHDRDGNPVPAGTIWRFSPDGKKWWLEMAGFRNQYDAAFNSRGDLFTFDADMEWDVGTPWYRPTRVNHCVPGAEFGWRSGTAKWPDYYFDSLPATLDVGRGSPTGVVFYEHTQFPAELQGSLLICDWSLGRILAVKLKPQGATYSGESVTLVMGNPLNVTDIEVDRDGSMIFSTGGRGSEGGVYRVTYAGPSKARGVPKSETIADALAMPQSQSTWAREAISAIKRRSGEAWSTTLAEKLHTGTAAEKQRALMLLAQFGPKPSVEQLLTAADDKDPGVRSFTTWLLGEHTQPQVAAKLASLLEDEDATVRRRACEAFVRSGQTPPAAALVKLLGSEDRWLRYSARAALVAVPVEQWRDRIHAANLSPRQQLELMLALYQAANDARGLQPPGVRFANLKTDELLDAARLAGLSLLATSKSFETFASELASKFPFDDNRLNAEAARIMAATSQPDAIAKLLTRLESDASQEMQIHYALCLRYIDKGWTPELTSRYLTWYEGTKEWEGGASFTPFLANIVGEHLKRLAPDERQQLVAAWQKHPFATQLVIDRSQPSDFSDFVGTMSRLVADLAMAAPSKDRDALLDTAIAALGKSDSPAVQASLRKLYDEQPDRRTELARTLAKQPTAENWPYLLKTLAFADSTTSQVCIAALNKSGRKPETPAEVRTLLMAGLNLGSNGGLAAANLLQKWTGEKHGASLDAMAALSHYQAWFRSKYPSEPPAELPKIDTAKTGYSMARLVEFLNSEAGQAGDVARGKLVFTKANCIKCHQFLKEGQGVGPDLTSVRRRFQQKEIIESILLPSKVIADQYRSVTVVTSTGLVHTGLPLPQTAEDKLTLVLPDATKLEIAKDDIEQQVQAKTSVMPEGLLKDLSLTDIADLFAFLETSKLNAEPPKAATASSVKP